MIRLDNNIIPSSLDERNQLRGLIARFVAGCGMVPPVSRGQLIAMSQELIRNEALCSELSAWLMVEINNHLWRDVFSAIPRGQKMLLLPQCLRNSKMCTAEMDELGLLCRRCGLCAISHLEEMAERMGMMCLVAEGITSASSFVGLFEGGAVDAVIGVGCLESLEKAFPLFVDSAMPAMAVALNCAGCKDTEVDAGYVEMLAALSKSPQIRTYRYDYQQLKDDVQQWFSADTSIHGLLDPSDPTSLIACNWLCSNGKRWRPYLLAAVYMAITGNAHIPESVKLAALSVEAFHKASLIHDDIQDNDQWRYGQPTINALHGIPIAINVGDRLLGDGYRLLASCGNMELITEASAAHIALCCGQGLELEWCRNPRPMTMNEVIRIIENKTVPAFGAALAFAVICAGGNEIIRHALAEFARFLGIAYQLLDDLDDFQTEKNLQLRPTSVFAAICETATDEIFTEKICSLDDFSNFLNQNQSLQDQAIERVKEMAENYRQDALNSLAPVQNTELKRLLFRVTKKILR